MVTEKIKEAILPAIKELDLDLYKVVYEKENGKNYLRVFLEREDYSLDLDTCVKASEIISKILDDIDPIKEEYFLEVASSGRERVFNDKQDYENNVDKYILAYIRELVSDYDELVGYLKEVTAIDSVYYKTNKDDYIKPKVLKITKNN